MSGKWIAMFLNIWVILVLLVATTSYQNTPETWPGTGTGAISGAYTPLSTLQYLMNISNAFQHLSILGGFPLPWPNPDYFSALWQVITLEPLAVMAGGGFAIFYWLVEGIAAMGVFALVMLVVGIVRGNLTWG